jgi:Domain of unknown function (DUF4340)
MNRQRFMALAVAALVVISAAFYFSGRRNPSNEPEGTVLLPSLATALNDVTEVSVRKGAVAPAVTIHKVGARWTVAQRAEYPADVTKLRKLLSSLGDAKIIEEKTADPARYVEIGVEDPAQPGASGAEITIIAPSAKRALIVGKTVGEGNFVRRVGEAQTFSVEPAISVETEPRFWIDARLLDVPAAQIQSIALKPAGGAAYAVHRVNPTDGAFSLDGVPAGRKPLDAAALAPASNTLTGLAAEDVAPLSDVDFTQSSSAIVTLTDGTILTLTGAVVGTKHWLQVASSKEESPAKTTGRAYEVASYRYDGIFRPLDQLLVPKESGPAGAAPRPAVPSRPAGAPRKPAPPAS